MHAYHIEAEKLIYFLIKEVGSQAKVARALNVTRATMSSWVNFVRKPSYVQFLKMKKMEMVVIKEKGYEPKKLPKAIMIDLNPEKIDLEVNRLTISERIKVGMRIEQRIGPRRRRPPLKIEDRFSSTFAFDLENFLSIFDTYKGRTAKITGESIGFSETTYRRGKYILQNGTPALIKAVDDKRIKIKVAARIARLSTLEQGELLCQSTEEVFRNFRQANAIRPEIRYMIDIASIQNLPLLRVAEKQYKMNLCMYFSCLVSFYAASGEFYWESGILKKEVFPYTDVNCELLLHAFQQCKLIKKVKRHNQCYVRIIHFNKFVHYCD